MNKTILHGERFGEVSIPASKSVAHRYLICAALSRGENRLKINGISDDIRATALCLDALFHNVSVKENEIIVSSPNIKSDDVVAELPCGESGTTLRLLLPLVGAIGKNAVFLMKGRLPERPISELELVLKKHGMKIEKRGDKLFCGGKLTCGEYKIPGDVSSQYISALLFALPVLNGESTLEVTGSVQSKDYITLTENALKKAGVKIEKNGFFYKIKGDSEFSFPKSLTVEGDWSAASAFLCMGAVSKGGITVSPLDVLSTQGDKELLEILKKIGANVSIDGENVTVKRGKLTPVVVDASNIPDVVPCLSALLAAVKGESRIINAERLKFKESNRLLSTSKMLSSLGAQIKETDDGLIINGCDTIMGGNAPTFDDHRIAMAAAVASSFCQNDVIVDNGLCVNKSYVNFFADLERLEMCR